MSTVHYAPTRVLAVVATRILRLTAAFALALLASCGSSSDNSWPLLAHRAGPYGELLTPGDAAAAAGDGFDLTLLSSSKTPLLDALAANGIRYLDTRVWNSIKHRCQLQYSAQALSGAARHCALSGADQSVILQEVAALIALDEYNPAVAGYWVLDDYPDGDITATLQAIHGLIAQSNARTQQRRPAICGVGGTLDRRLTATGPFVADHGYTSDALQNVTPLTCDVIAPYFYGTATVNDAAWVDWTMQDLMPWFLSALTARGYDHPSLLPVVQAFSTTTDNGASYYVEPAPADMAAQATAYCGNGAIALLFFTWSGPGLDHTYVNDPELRTGVSAAAEACREAGVSLPTVLPAGG